MVNNVDIIRGMISFNDEFDFYFLQILKRRKDNPDMPRDMVVITNYHIESFEQYDSLMPHIINMCESENARAYFRVNRRNYKHLSHHMLKRVVDMVGSGTYKALKGSFDSVCGKYHNDKDKKWIVDIDWEDKHNIDSVKNELYRLQYVTKRKPMLEVVPSKNGFHFITRPFNLTEFKGRFSNIDVHKDNPCLLYCP